VESPVLLFQANLGPVGTAVPLYVSQSLLGDAEYTQRSISRDAMRNIPMHKIDPHVLLYRELLAEGFQASEQP
jgi:hypothetical protein